MGNKTLVYKQKLTDNLTESYKHLLRLENAFRALNSYCHFPMTMDDFKKVIESVEHLAYSDQIIYRFSKLQDCMGAKLFKSVLDNPNQGLYIENLIWREMKDFSPDCVLVVLASEHYNESDYIREYDMFLKEVKKEYMIKAMPSSFYKPRFIKSVLRYYLKRKKYEK